MRYLWFSWKDSTHPRAGGAEYIVDALLSRLARDGHEVHLISGWYEGCQKDSMYHGYRITRLGGTFTVYIHAFIYYRRHRRQWADLVIDEMNTIPFFCRFFVQEPSVLFVHQLCREIWFYQMIFPLSLLGYCLEPMYLWLLRQSTVITISLSTQKDLLRYGYDEKKVMMIPEGVVMLREPSQHVHPTIRTVLAFGSIRSMKRTHHVLRAFEIAKQSLPAIRLLIVGKPIGGYGKKILRSIQASPFRQDITVYGPVSEDKKENVLRLADILCCASVKEGWGLVVTEANTQGVPAIVYDVDGLRESVRHGTTGMVVPPNSFAMAQAIVSLASDPMLYARLQENCATWSQTFTEENMYQAFRKALGQAPAP